MPQIGDEVLVGFNQGDVREPFVLGTLWNTIDRPPALLPTDAVTQRKIRTPLRTRALVRRGDAVGDADVEHACPASRSIR